LAFLTENEASFAHLSLSRAIVAPNSDVAFRRLKTSLQDCLSNHPSCARTLSGTVADEEKSLPTRIIDIGLGHVRADLATFGSKLMECEKTENRKNRYFKEFNKLKLF
jgi:hypothetical protein